MGVKFPSQGSNFSFNFNSSRLNAAHLSSVQFSSVRLSSVRMPGPSGHQEHSAGELSVSWSPHPHPILIPIPECRFDPVSCTSCGPLSVLTVATEASSSSWVHCCCPSRTSRDWRRDLRWGSLPSNFSFFFFFW